MKLKSDILKLALFATGLSGIVAEYVLSTLATYFLGNAVIQWTLIVSVMLFSMGLGSRFSKLIHHNLLQNFISIEFLLSLLTAFSSLIVYTLAAYSAYTGFFIYALSTLIGIMIGMEIPLVIRINDSFEALRVNVSSAMEKDYYGSLAGGVFFAFVGLPFLGLTYTPFVLGAINFAVALVLLWMLWKELGRPSRLRLGGFSASVIALLLTGVIIAKPVVLFGEQKRYKDKIIYSEQSKYQKIVMTQWQDDYWLFINGNQQLSTLDEQMYHEPLVHPIMQLHPNPQQVLIMGGGDGCAAREVLKYTQVQQITLVDLDPAMTDLGRKNPVLVELNDNALNNKKVQIINQDGFIYLEQAKQYFDVIIIDLPDPNNSDLGKLYSVEFYELVKRKLRPNGLVITQAGSPYFATKAFLCIEKTMKEAGLNVIPLHNQVITLGEWGWIMGSKNDHLDLKQQLRALHFDNVQTRWINHEAMNLITSFGKDVYAFPVDSVEVNRIHNPVLYRYYLEGNWDLY